jgi:uncharacterized membrane protein
MKLARKFLKRKESVVEVIVLFLIFFFLLEYFKPSLILSKTTITGGDTASQYYPAYFLKNYLLPKGKIVGWNPGWYAGFPMFQFYFPLLFFLSALLSYLIPLQISFKIITVLGTFLLPIAAFFSMKLINFKFPIPAIAAIFTLPFLFMEANSMWGGNIPSTLAGEFSHSFSLSLTVLFLGLLYKGIEKKKFLISNSIVFALITLSHVYTMLFALFTSAFFLLEKEFKKFLSKFKYLFSLYFLSFLLTSFWVLPFVFNLEWTTAYNFVWFINNLRTVFPEILLPFLAFSILGIFLGIKKRDKRIFFLLFSAFVSLALFEIAPYLNLVNVRFIPPLQLFPLFIGAYGLAEITEKVKVKWLLLLIVLFLTIFWINKNVTYIKAWIKWNYEGFEGKASWETFNSINKFLSGSYKDPRVVYEHSPLHNSFGSIRAFESLPLFSGRSTLEGLYMQSTVTSPFVFYIQSEISEVASCPLPGYACSPFNLEAGTKHLEMFNVKYFVARSEKVKSALKENENYKLAYRVENYEIYELKTNENKYVIVPKYEPVLVETNNWKNLSYEWFKRVELAEIPLVFTSKVDSKDLAKFKNIVNDLHNLPKIPIDNNCSVEENIEIEEIEINTNCIGKPHIIRISYHPNWKVEGADKVYLVSPSFMLIFPNQQKVRLFYGYSTLDIIGMILSLTGLVILLLLGVKTQLNYIKQHLRSMFKAKSTFSRRFRFNIHFLYFKTFIFNLV